MAKTKILERKSPLQLVEEFPDFNPDWPDKKKLEWFDDFIQLFEHLDEITQEGKGG